MIRYKKTYSIILNEICESEKWNVFVVVDLELQKNKSLGIRFWV